MAIKRARTTLIWTGLTAALTVPIALAGTSPLLAYRDATYILAGFAGILAMALLLVQPLLAGQLLPGINATQARRLHRGIGILIVLAVALHVAGLWITSPPDVIDALTFRAPAAFSLWGVIAMWALIVTAGATSARKRLGLRLWRKLHLGLALLIVGTTAAHALLIEGTMEPISKAALSALLLIATAATVLRHSHLLSGKP